MQVLLPPYLRVCSCCPSTSDYIWYGWLALFRLVVTSTPDSAWCAALPQILLNVPLYLFCLVSLYAILCLGPLPLLLLGAPLYSRFSAMHPSTSDYVWCPLLLKIPLIVSIYPLSYFVLSVSLHPKYCVARTSTLDSAGCAPLPQILLSVPLYLMLSCVFLLLQLLLAVPFYLRFWLRCPYIRGLAACAASPSVLCVHLFYPLLGVPIHRAHYPALCKTYSPKVLLRGCNSIKFHGNGNCI